MHLCARARWICGFQRERGRNQPLRILSIGPNWTINGEARSLVAPATVAALLDEMGLTGKRLAVERNGEIVPKGLHAGTQLVDGDRLEIVVAVGGG